MNRRWLVILMRSLIVFTLFSWAEAHADILDQWQWINPLPQGNTLYSVAYGSNMFVAVGLKGTIITSPDGYAWETRQTKNTGNLYAIAYAANIFVAVGQTGTIMTSSDGVHWLSRTSGTVHDLQAIAYGKNRFVAVGSNGVLLTSLNGQDWTIQVSGTVSDLACIAYGNGIFVIGGENTLTSPDGITWVVRERCINCGYYSFNSIIYEDDVFVAAGYRHCGDGLCSTNPGTTILISSDGTAWTTKAFISGGSVSELVHGNDKFVATGFIEAGGGGATFTSPDCITWAEHYCSSCGFGMLLKGIGYGNNTYVAVGDQGIILVSSDGITWMDSDSRVLRRDARLKDITYGSAGFVAVGGAWHSQSITYENLGPMEEGYMPVLTSLEGLEWTAQNSGISLNTFNAVAYGSNTYVIVGRNGLILTSPDGVDWTLRHSDKDLEINVLAYGNNTFVAVGNDNIVLTSHDGINWTKRISENINIPNDLAYGGGLFVAVGSNGMIITSPDGIAWTKRVSGTTSELKGVSYGNNLFVAVGSKGIILTSPDGAVWTERVSGTTNDLSGIDFGSIYFVAYGTTGVVINLVNYVTEGIVLTSVDGIAWAVKNTPNPRLCGIAYGAETMIAIGRNAEIMKAAGLELSDAVLALQILTGKPPAQLTYKYADVDKDGIISLQDVIYIMQIIVSLR